MKTPEKKLIAALRYMPKGWYFLDGKRLLHQDNLKKADIKEVLTEKEKEMLKIAEEMGYYDYPRRTTINKMARGIKINAATICVYLQKIQSKIIKNLE